MNVWSGSITLNEDHCLDGIGLVDTTTYWQCDISKAAKLRLCAFVNPALIPLHARAGPNLELHTTVPTTSRWLRNKLMGAVWVGEETLDLQQSQQCPVGLLVSVESFTAKRTSDLLIYGVLSNTASGSRPPTPPHSSPTETVRGPNPPTRPYELRIYATPLSNMSITQAQSYPSPPPSANGEQHPTQAEFIPSIGSPSPKRKRVNTLFESAAQHHLRVRQRGGEGVSQLMAPSRPQSSSQNLQSIFVKREPEDEPTKGLDRILAHRSRSMSIGTNLQRPGSNRGTRTTPGIQVDPKKRAQTPNPFLESTRRGSLQVQQLSLTSAEEEHTAAPSSPPKSPEAIIAQNKDLITRTVLTCMRVYGFHRLNQRTKSTAGQAGADLDASNANPAVEPRPETPAPGPSADDDEFKAMYHATYKAAAFALRKYVKDHAGSSGSSIPLLEKGKAMTCIDELLRIFCEDH